MVPRNQPEGRRAGDAGSGPWEGPADVLDAIARRVEALGIPCQVSY